MPGSEGGANGFAEEYQCQESEDVFEALVGSFAQDIVEGKENSSVLSVSPWSRRRRLSHMLCAMMETPLEVSALAHRADLDALIPREDLGVSLRARSI